MTSDRNSIIGRRKDEFERERSGGVKTHVRFVVHHGALLRSSLRLALRAARVDPARVLQSESESAAVHSHQDRDPGAIHQVPTGTGQRSYGVGTAGAVSPMVPVAQR